MLKVFEWVRLMIVTRQGWVSGIVKMALQAGRLNGLVLGSGLSIGSSSTNVGRLTAGASADFR